MKEQESNVSNKDVYISILAQSSYNSRKSVEQDKNSRQKIFRYEWRKVLKIMKDVSSAVSVVISLIKILEDLGLLP